MLVSISTKPVATEKTINSPQVMRDRVSAQIAFRREFRLNITGVHVACGPM